MFWKAHYKEMLTSIEMTCSFAYNISKQVALLLRSYT